jgi:DNA-binding NtrC family response regulator
MLGASAQMVMLKQATLRAARSDLPVLIEGPTGGGKELVARAIHELGVRAGKPFIAVNCAALPTALFESELFGHVKGAFTGAMGDRRGLVLGAHEGTLFLDEVGDLAADSQGKLLRLLQTLEVRPVGSDSTRKADVRIVAATNRPLWAAVNQRRFREDLYYRLAVVHVVVPSLSERRGDIPLLARAMVQSFAPRQGLSPPHITDEAYAQLESHGWPGNVRELENVVKRTLADLDGGTITSFSIAHGDPPAANLERARLETVLREVGGNLAQAARKLGVSRPTLYKRLEQLGLNPDVYRRP